MDKKNINIKSFLSSVAAEMGNHGIQNCVISFSLLGQIYTRVISNDEIATDESREYETLSHRIHEYLGYEKQKGL